ncbi:MAG: VCBS repeat-containing protein [Pirellulaceae bacterium]
MRRLILGVFVLTGVTVAGAAEFAAPVRLSGGGQAVRVESPGYAAPCWADVDGDGKKDLLVGQFNNGKIRVYRNLGKNKLAAGQWLQAEGQVAQIPGIW